jgi:tellurite resistance protein
VRPPPPNVATVHGEDVPGYFEHNRTAHARRATVQVSEDFLAVMSFDEVPERLRPFARSLGMGSALSVPQLLQRDLVNFYDDPALHNNVSGPATAALLGGSISSEGELEATGVSFSMSSGLVGFVTFAVPAALLLPGGGFYVAYRLFRMVRDTAALRRYARVSRAAPHIAIAVAASDAEITRDEARLLRDLIRGRVGSPAERHELLRLELDPSAKQDAAFDALAELRLEDDDWSDLLSIAIATAHADDDYSGEERDIIHRLRAFTGLSIEAFERMAADAEADYMLRCHIGESMVRTCYQIARGGERELPDDAAPLLDIVLSAAVPSDAERETLAVELLSAGGPTAVSRDELTRGASDAKPSLFKRVAGARSESARRVLQFGETMALFVATLEQWRGWVVQACRDEMIAIGEGYGLGEKQLLRWVRRAHASIERQRKDWIAPRPWEAHVEPDLDAVAQHAALEGAFGVTGLAGGRFLFRAGDTGWEWKSSDTHFDVFCRHTLDVEVDELVVHTDDATFELLKVTVQAHESEVRLRRPEEL